MTVIISQSFQADKAEKIFTEKGYTFKRSGDLFKFTKRREFNNCGMDLAMARPVICFMSSPGTDYTEQAGGRAIAAFFRD